MNLNRRSVLTFTTERPASSPTSARSSPMFRGARVKDTEKRPSLWAPPSRQNKPRLARLALALLAFYNFLIWIAIIAAAYVLLHIVSA